MGHHLPASPHSDLWQALQELEPKPVDCRDPVLFRRGEPCRGIYIVEEGRVKLLLTSNVFDRQAFEIVGSGAVLGLAETMVGGEYRLSAEALEGARVSHVERQTFLEQMRLRQQLCLQIVHLLSEDLHSLYHHFRRMVPAAKRSGKGGSAHVC